MSRIEELEAERKALLEARDLDSKRIAELGEERDALKAEKDDCPWCSVGEKPLLTRWTEVITERHALRKALKPFVDFANCLEGVNWVPDGCPVTADPAGKLFGLSVLDFRRARETTK